MTFLDTSRSWRKPVYAPDTVRRVDRTLMLVAHAYKIAVRDLLGPRNQCDARCRWIDDARAVAMYLLHVDLGLAFSDVGGVLGRHRTVASVAVRKVEEWRETASFDCWLDELEERVNEHGNGSHRFTRRPDRAWARCSGHLLQNFRQGGQDFGDERAP